MTSKLSENLRFCSMEPQSTFDGSGTTAREAIQNALDELEE